MQFYLPYYLFLLSEDNRFRISVLLCVFWQNMWDLTPDTDLLNELPEEYNFVTALADLIVSFSEQLGGDGTIGLCAQFVLPFRCSHSSDHLPG